MKRIYLIGTLVLGLLGLTQFLQAQLVTQTLNFTGAVQTVTLPGCVVDATITAYGASGANGASTASGAVGGTGGLGAMASGVYTFSTAQPTLNIYVGGAASASVGGFNGGGNGSNGNSGAGGGASDVRLNGTALTDRIIVAGGGGGGGTAGCASSTISGGDGGAGGGGNGTAGVNSQAGGGGQGGSGATGGAAGVGCPLASGTVGVNGTSGIGGDGGASVLICGSRPSGGGGGGGFIGGGGGGGGSAGTSSCSFNDTGAGGGGAGGTNYFASGFTGTAVTNGTQTGNGYVIISYSIGAPPAVSASGGATICSGATVTLTASGAPSYSWSNSQTTSTIAVSPTTTTSYTVTGSGGPGCTNTAVVTVSVNQRPTLTLTSNPATASLCSGSSATLSVSGASTYAWSTAATTTSISVSPSITTLYTLTATNPASLGACTATTSINLTVVTTPTVTASASPTLICNGSSSTLTASGASTYSWNTTATTNTISVNPTVTTVYTVTGNNGACAHTRTVSLTVSPVPTVAASNVTMCTGQTRTLTASNASTYTWTTPTSSATTATISVSPSVTTEYTVSGTSTAGCVSAPKTVTVTVNITPTNIGFAASTTSVCSGNTATLTGTGTFTNYTWTGGVSNGVSFTPSTALTPSGVANYTVTGTAANSCTSSAVASITVVITPSAAITSSTIQICPGGSFTLTAPMPAGASISWSPVAATTNTIADSPTLTTVYTATRTNLTCTNVSAIQVTVNTVPGVLSFAQPTLVCAGKQTTLTAGAANTYTWVASTPAVPTVTGQVVTFNPQVPTTYTVTGSNGFCLGTSIVTVAVDPNPTISIAITNSATICRNQSATLTANTTTASPGISYSWTASSGTSVINPTLNPIVITPTTTTSYSVIVTNTYNCSSMVSTVIVVNQLPVFTATVAPTKSLVCSGGQSTVGVAITPSTGVTYSWSTGNLTRTVQVSPLATNVYTATVTSNTSGCKNTGTVTVSVFIPTMTVVGPTATCYGGNITLSGSIIPTPGIPSYTWNGNYFFQNFSATPTVASVYLVSGTTSSNNVACVASATTAVTIFSNPTVTAVGQPSAICKDEATSLIGSGASTYQWSDTQTGSPVTVSPTVQTTYTVIGTDINGCKDTNTVLIKVSFCTGITGARQQASEFITVYPNPNTGEFMIQSDAEASLRLINELGQVVKIIQVINSENNKISAGDLPAGIYYLSGEKDGTRVMQKIIINKD